MACELTVVSNQNFLFGSNLNCPDVPVPICPPGNYTLVPIIQNGCITSYNCVLVNNSVDPFITNVISSSGRAGTVFFPDSQLINFTCQNFSNLESFIPSLSTETGRAGTIFFPDFDAKLCVN